MDLSKSIEVFKPDKYNDKIHIIGCGSVGSTLAENLTRLGLVNFVLWDFDDVETHNIANQMFTARDVGMKKIDALARIMSDINPEVANHIELKYEGWQGEILEGFVFLAVDNIEIRKNIVDTNKMNLNIRAMFDFRTGLNDAQHYAADWSDYKHKKDFRNSMEFSAEEADIATPRSACNVLQSVCPTIRMIVGIGVSNFMNFWTGAHDLKKVALIGSGIGNDAYVSAF